MNLINRIINTWVNASPKQWAIRFLKIGFIFGIISGGYFFIKSIIEDIPILLSLVTFLFVFFISFIISGGIPALAMFLIHLSTKNKPEFWSPSQTEVVKDICAHLTDEEKFRIKKVSALYGLWGGLTFVAPLTFAVSRPSRYSMTIAAISLFISLISLPFWQRNQKNILCSTEYAKTKGYKPEQIKLFSFRRKPIKK